MGDFHGVFPTPWKDEGNLRPVEPERVSPGTFTMARPPKGRRAIFISTRLAIQQKGRT